MKRKSILGRVAIIAMALTLATTSMMSGTLARYETSASVEPYALIARWNPAITGGGTAGTSESLLGQTITKTIDLAATAVYGGNEGLGGVSASTKVGDNSNVMIAPGTSGRYMFKVDVSNTDVPVVLKITAKKNSDYKFPDHLKVVLKDGEGSKQFGQTMVGKWFEGNYIGPFSQKDSFDLVGGTKSEENGGPMYFRSLKEAGGATRSQTFMLIWDWPMEATSLASTSGETSAKYTDNDNDYGKGTVSADSSVVNNKFGFDLEINLAQADNKTQQQVSSEFTIVGVTS